MKIVYVPEAPDFPGLYANDTAPPHDDGSKLGQYLHPKPVSTYGFHFAMKFNNKEECDEWCIKNPYPVFVTREHGIMESGNKLPICPSLELHE